MLSFRQARSHPGARLYRQLDDVRPVLQVSGVPYLRHWGGSYRGGVRADTGLSVVVCVVLLQVHDELVFEVRTQHLGAVAAIVRECMEGAVVLNVPLHVKLSTGPSWGSLRSLASCEGEAAPLPAVASVCPEGQQQGDVNSVQRLGRAAAVNLPPSQVQLAAGSARVGTIPAVPPPIVRDLFGKD